MVAVAAAILAGAASAGQAQDSAALKFATVSPAEGPLTRACCHPWAARVNASGEPSVALDVRDGYVLANFGNVYDGAERRRPGGLGLQGTIAASSR